MVYTNNNLRNKKNKRQQDIVSEDRQELNNGLPVYPFDVDVASIPERKYLMGMYSFAKWTCALLGVFLILCAAVVWQAYSRNVWPILVNWNDVENSFEYSSMYYGDKPKENVERLGQGNYLNEFFIQEYLNKRFGISRKIVENYNNWCDCQSNSNSDETNRTKISALGYFNLDEECYVCKFSSSDVYSTFLNNEYAAYNKFAENGETRRVIILDMKKFRSTVGGGHSNVSLPTQILDYIFKGKSSQAPLPVRNYYRVDFVVEITKDGKLENQDVMIAYIETSEYESRPQIKTVVKADYMFNPSYDIMLQRYAQKVNVAKGN